MVSKIKWAVVLILAITTPVACIVISDRGADGNTPPANASDTAGVARTGPPTGKSESVEGVLEVGGRRFEIVEGNAYEIDGRTGNRVLRDKVYQYGFYSRSYRTVDGKIYRLVDGGNDRYPVFNELSEDFEGVNGIRNLVGIDRGWTYFMLMSPKAPTLESLVALRHRIMGGKSDFLDNRVEPSQENAHSGRASLKSVAVPATKQVPVTKASLGTELLHFANGDEVWFSGWFYIKEGRPATIVDLESSYFFQGAGMRLLLNDQREPRLELKWPTRPTYSMKQGVRYRMPMNRWVHVRLHYVLNEQDGVAQLWMDDQLLIDGRGQTMPLASAVYDRLEVGITANPVGVTTILFSDDIQISRTPVY